MRLFKNELRRPVKDAKVPRICGGHSCSMSAAAFMRSRAGAPFIQQLQPLRPAAVEILLLDIRRFPGQSELERASQLGHALLRALPEWEIYKFLQRANAAMLWIQN